MQGRGWGHETKVRFACWAPSQETNNKKTKNKHKNKNKIKNNNKNKNKNKNNNNDRNSSSSMTFKALRFPSDMTL